jgi:Rv0078B-related antitoxin
MDMKPARDPAVMARARATFDLYETAEAMMRQNLRRRFPGEGDEQIELRLLAWLRDRPGAEHGDAGGPVQPRKIFE